MALSERKGGHQTLMSGSTLRAVAEGEGGFEQVAALELIPEPGEAVCYFACWGVREHHRLEMQEEYRHS